MDQIKNESSGSVTFNAWLLLRSISLLKIKICIRGDLMKKSIKVLSNLKLVCFIYQDKKLDQDLMKF